MAKFVIFKQGDDYKFTTEENYASRISNARRIATFKPDNGFKDAKIVLDYILRTSPDMKAEDIRVLTESADSENDESRYNGIVDQIDVLLGMQADSGHLSGEQRKQLAELRDRVYAYGERGAKWADLCDEALNGVSPKLESMMDFYARFVNSFDCPRVLAEASMNMFKEVLLEASQSGDVAERLRQKVGVNPNETQGVGVFGISGDDNLPQQTTINNEISDAMVSGTFDTLGDNISTADPNNFDETSMGLGSSELDTSGNDLNPDDWASAEDETATGEQPAPEDAGEPEASTEPVDGDDGDDIDAALDSTFEAVENPAQEYADAKIKRYLATGGEKAADTVQMLLLGDSYEDCRLSMYTARQYLFGHKHLLGDDVSDSDVPALPFARRTIYELVDSAEGPEKTSMLSDIVDFAASHGSMDELDTLEKYLG